SRCCSRPGSSDSIRGRCHRATTTSMRCTRTSRSSPSSSSAMAPRCFGFSSRSSSCSLFCFSGRAGAGSSTGSSRERRSPPSLALSTTYAVLAVFVSALVGYGFARHRAPGHSKLFVLVIATWMVPNLVLFVPQFVLFARLGLTDTYWPWILWGLSGSPFAIFLFRQFFATFPRELDDAAEVEGAGPLRIFHQIYLPNAGPALAARAIFMFLWVWGDWLYPALLLRQDNTTLAVRMANAYLDPHGNPLQTVTMAGVALYVLPLIAFFAFA